MKKSVLYVLLFMVCVSCDDDTLMRAGGENVIVIGNCEVMPLSFAYGYAVLEPVSDTLSYWMYRQSFCLVGGMQSGALFEGDSVSTPVVFLLFDLRSFQPLNSASGVYKFSSLPYGVENFIAESAIYYYPQGINRASAVSTQKINELVDGVLSILVTGTTYEVKFEGVTLDNVWVSAYYKGLYYGIDAPIE